MIKGLLNKLKMLDKYQIPFTSFKKDITMLLEEKNHQSCSSTNVPIYRTRSFLALWKDTI